MYLGERVFLAEETENAKALRQGYGKFKENQGDQCGWSRVSEGQSDRRWSQREQGAERDI